MYKVCGVACVVAVFGLFAVGCQVITCTVDEDCPIGFVCAVGGSPPRCIEIGWDAAVVEAGWPWTDSGPGMDAGAAICTDPGDDDCMTDPFDPGNGGMGSATPILLNTCYCGMGICAPDTDYYEIQLPTAGGLRATMTFFQSEGDLDVSLYICARPTGACNGTALMTATSFTDDEVLEIPAGLIAGRYLLRVYSKFGYLYENPDYCLMAETLP